MAGPNGRVHTTGGKRGCDVATLAAHCCVPRCGYKAASAEVKAAGLAVDCNRLRQGALGLALGSSGPRWRGRSVKRASSAAAKPQLQRRQAGCGKGGWHRRLQPGSMHQLQGRRSEGAAWGGAHGDKGLRRARSRCGQAAAQAGGGGARVAGLKGRAGKRRPCSQHHRAGSGWLASRAVQLWPGGGSSRTLSRLARQLGRLLCLLCLPWAPCRRGAELCGCRPHLRLCQLADHCCLQAGQRHGVGRVGLGFLLQPPRVDLFQECLWNGGG